MAGYGKWLAIVGGILAVIGQFYGASFYLPVIGGLLAIVGGFLSQ